jgi:hypothetical protein
MKYHIKVLLGNGIFESYYCNEIPESFTTFKRDDGSVDYWADDFVKGVQVAPFKGILINIEGDELYSQGTTDKDVINALKARIVELQKKLSAVRQYLLTKYVPDGNEKVEVL